MIINYVSVVVDCLGMFSEMFFGVFCWIFLCGGYDSVVCDV